MFRTVRSSVSVVIGSLCAAAAAGQAVTTTPEAKQRPEAIREDSGPVSLILAPRGQFQLRGDLDNAGSVAVQRAGGDLTVALRLTDDLRLDLSGGGEASWYDFNGAAGLIPRTAAPISRGYETSFGPSIFWRIDKEWSVFGGGFLEFGSEKDVFRSSAARYGGFGGARYAFSDDLAVSFGLRVSTRLASSVLYLPVAGVEWKISDRLRFDTRGPGAALTLTLTEEFDLALRGEYQRREFRLADDRPQLADGVLVDTAVPVGLELAWKPAPWVRLSFEAGVVVYQEFTAKNRDGVKVGSDKTDPAAYLGVFGTLRF